MEQEEDDMPLSQLRKVSDRGTRIEMSDVPVEDSQTNMASEGAESQGEPRPALEVTTSLLLTLT